MDVKNFTVVEAGYLKRVSGIVPNTTNQQV